MNLVERNQCCGCGACNSICPKKAIQMTEDEEGFIYPVISEHICINCGLCQKVCPVNGDKTGAYENPEYKQRYFAAFHKLAQVVENSSSGGVFTAITDIVLAQNGVIYGAYMDEGFVVRHGRAQDSHMRDRFRGSKYVQSNMLSVYEEIAEDVSKGIMTLFAGTPCQVKAVQKFLEAKNVSKETLYTVDFICHGVSSPGIWKDYIGYLEKRYDCSLDTYIFRGKKEGWHNWYPIVTMKGNGKDVSEELRRNDSFILMYQSMLFNRPSCFSCPFTSYDRAGDITLADFWNIKKISPDMDTDRGTSELLINSAKGQELLDACKDLLKLLECSKQDVWQPHLEYPNAMPGGREKFWNCYRQEGMEGVIKKYGKGDAMTRVKNFATPILKKTGLYVLFGKLYQIIFVKK